MNAVVGRQYDTVGGTATGIVCDGCAIVRQNQTDLLIGPCLELLGITQSCEKALIVRLSEQIDLFRLRGETRR